jgi:hypothetical protein
MKVCRKITERVQVSGATVPTAIGTDHPDARAKFLYLAIERIQGVSPAAMQQDERRPCAFIAIVDLYRTNAGNKWGRL